MRSKSLAALYLLVRLGLAALFIVAGLIKLASPQVFAVTLKAVGLVPSAVVPALSVALPLAEVVVGVLLACDIRGTLALTCGLLGVFLVVLGYALGMGLDIDCGCYGPSDPEREAFSSIRQAMLRDTAMLAGAAFLYWWRRANGWRGRRVPGLGEFLQTVKEKA